VTDLASDSPDFSSAQPDSPDTSNHAIRTDVGAEQSDAPPEHPRPSESAEDPSNRVARTDVTDTQRAQEYRDMAQGAKDTASLYSSALADARREQTLLAAPGGGGAQPSAPKTDGGKPATGRR
jgi:hypothetical protein